MLKTADIISGKWTLLVLRDLAQGINRFSALERSLQGISPKTLSERLKALEKAGVITRKSYAEVPPRVEYSLTARGLDLIPLIDHMRDYGSKWLMEASNGSGGPSADCCGNGSGGTSVDCCGDGTSGASAACCGNGSSGS
ncbi:MAG TPA: helix-turn-helix domain-containing protein [Thermoleophilia bacterium]|nr:helix-turn-helix domain-containing protein [Thermoleophilia bacterium]